MAVNPKVRDLSILLPLAGVLLLMSPVLQVFNSLTLIFGVPVIVLYIFGVWLGLIILGAWLSRHQREIPSPDSPPANSAPLGTLAPNTFAAESEDRLPAARSKDGHPAGRA